MERLKPIDLDKAKLKTAFRGYDRAAVDETLQRASSEIERLLAELRQLHEESERMRKELDHFRSQESTLKEALVLAQKASDETRANAHKKAELILEEARQHAVQVQQELQSRVNDLRWELERLSLEKQRFLARFRSLLEHQLGALSESEPRTPSLFGDEFSMAVGSHVVSSVPEPGADSGTGAATAGESHGVQQAESA